MISPLLNRLNPFKGLDRPREVWAWGMYDLANQSFTLLIITLLFPIYFRQVVVGDESRGDWLWALAQGSSLLLVVAVSPLVGAMADARSLRKQVLIATGLVCSVATACLALSAPGWIWLAALTFILGNVMYQIGENFLASFLPDVSTSRTIGRVSATGWAMGYVGALVLLVITALGMKLLAIGNGQIERWNVFFILAGVWFVLGMIPAWVLLKERRSIPSAPSGGFLKVAAEGVARVGQTLRRIGRFRDLAVFLTGFFVYGFGVQTVIAFAGILAQDFGIRDQKLVLFVLQLTVTAGAAAIATSFFQDRIGAKITVLLYLAVWIASCAAMAVIAGLSEKQEWMFWAVGNGLGLGLGGIGTASRSMVGRFTPRHRSGEFFGLWALSYKLAGAIGVLSFGYVKSTLGTQQAVILLTSFFIVGAVIVLFVRESRGVRAALRTERTDRQAGVP